MMPILNHKIRLLTICLAGELAEKEIPLFRGAVLGSMGAEADVLYHNHIGEDGFRYRYPLIQYKRIHQKAAFVCVNEGADVIGQFLCDSNLQLQIGEDTRTFEVAEVIPSTCLIQVWNDTFHYRLRRWMPLNGENYSQYIALESMTDKVALLERVLVGNILSMCKGLGINIEEQIDVHITNVTRTYSFRYKGVRHLVFDVEFATNMSLPQWAGLGRNASMGCGTISRIKQSFNKSSNDK